MPTSKVTKNMCQFLFLQIWFRFDFNKWSRSKFLKSSENYELKFLEFLVRIATSSLYIGSSEKRPDQKTPQILKIHQFHGFFQTHFLLKSFWILISFFIKKNTLVFQKRSILILKLEDFRWHFIVLRIPPFLKNKTIESLKLLIQRSESKDSATATHSLLRRHVRSSPTSARKLSFICKICHAE